VESSRDPPNRLGRGESAVQADGAHSQLLLKPAMVASIAPVVAAFAAVLLTTLVLFTIQSYLATEHLLLVYLLPTILVATYFGSIIAVLTSLAGGLAVRPNSATCRRSAIYMLLAVTASKVVAALGHETTTKKVNRVRTR
jgi:hypothetical protein